MTANYRNGSHNTKPLICVYTNEDRNEFAIGLQQDQSFRSVTKVGESYTRFVDAYNLTENQKSELDWKKELKKWIVAAKKNESIFVEVDLGAWNEYGERTNYL
jgi:hypothetical protein